MSFPKQGRTVRPESGKTFPNSPGRIAASDSEDFAAVISKTLRETFGGTRASVKMVMAYTGARDRTVKNWFEGKNAPNGENLIKLLRYSDEVLVAVLFMAGREDILAAKLLVDARDKLVEMLEIVDQWRANDSATDPPNG